MEEHRCNSVVVTGPTANVGKSTVSINLAIAFARRLADRVILVDLDLRHPSIGAALGVRVRHGVDQVSYHNFDINNAFIRVPALGIMVLGCKSRHEDSSEILTSSGMLKLINELSTTFKDHVVIFDMPPAIGCDDVAAVSPVMKSAVVVVEEGCTTRDELNATLSAIKNTPVLSVVRNRSKSRDFKKYHY